MTGNNQHPTFKLNTGAGISSIALGTWESSDEDAYKAVLTALKTGYRHIDTAAIYGNEAAVGRGIRDSGVPRDQLFVTTKLWCTDFAHPEQALDTSLKKLGLDYVDLYLMHWPVALDSHKKVDKSITFQDTWAKMQKLPHSKARAIGVSNFTVAKLKELLEAPTTTVTPAALQVELHVNLQQQKLIDFCKSKGIVVEAYSPLARGNLDNSVVKKIAEKHNVSPASVVLAWGIQRGTVVLPKSVTPERIESNFVTPKLDDEEMKQITSIGKERKRHVQFPFDDVQVFAGEEDDQP